MSQLSFQIYDDATLDTQLADFSARVRGLQFSTGKHGFASCSGFVPMGMDEAFAVYSWEGTAHVQIVNGIGAPVWQGRLEDVAIVPGGVQLGAFGRWRALTDLPYTGLWSSTDYKSWYVCTDENRSDMRPDQFKFSKTGFLNVALVKNETYTANTYGGMFFEVPRTSPRNVRIVEFDYEFYAAAGYAAQFLSVQKAADSEAFSGFFAGWTLNGNGSVQSGSQSVTTQDWPGAFFGIRVPGTTYTNDTGARYLKITNLRVKTTTETSVLASDIAANMMAYINNRNAGQIDTSRAFVTETSTDLLDVQFDDTYPADILDELATLENFRAAVWENGTLYFGAKGAGRNWYIDADAFEIERSLEDVRNSAYAKYRGARGQTVRTDEETDSDSQSRYGVIRRGVVNVNTSDETEAETHRDAWLTDQETVMRANVEFSRLYDASGAEWPLYMLRADDNVFIRNLPPTLDSAVDSVRSFVVGSTTYDVDNNEISIEPEVPTPTLVTLIAKKK